MVQEWIEEDAFSRAGWIVGGVAIHACEEGGCRRRHAMQSNSGSNIYSNSNKTQLQELCGTAHSMVQMKSILVKRKRKITMKLTIISTMKMTRPRTRLPPMMNWANPSIT